MHVVDNTGLMGRWQILPGTPIVICDTAHNKEGIMMVMEQLLAQEYENLHLVLGFVQDKNLDAILPLFPKQAQYYLARPDIRRGLDVNILAGAMSEKGFNSTIYNSVPEALIQARSNAGSKDLIFVGGSTFTVAEVL